MTYDIHIYFRNQNGWHRPDDPEDPPQEPDGDTPLYGYDSYYDLLLGQMNHFCTQSWPDTWDWRAAREGLWLHEDDADSATWIRVADLEDTEFRASVCVRPTKYVTLMRRPTDRYPGLEHIWLTRSPHLRDPERITEVQWFDWANCRTRIDGIPDEVVALELGGRLRIGDTDYLRCDVTVQDEIDASPWFGRLLATAKRLEQDPEIDEVGLIRSVWS